MQVTLDKKAGLHHHLKVSIDSKTIDTEIAKGLEEVAKTAKVDGFRPGKVPAATVRKMFLDRVKMSLVNKLIDETLPKALAEKKVNIASRPAIEDMSSMEEGKEFTYTAAFDVFPEVTPKKYTDIKITKPTASVEQKQIDSVVARLAEQKMDYEIVKQEAKKGHRVKINAKGYKGKNLDEFFEGSDLKEHALVLGSGNFIPGFEEELNGLKAGDKKSFEITFPKDYHVADLANAKTKFDVEVVEVAKPKKTELDDQMAKEYGAENLEDLKAKIKDQISKDLEVAIETNVKKELLDALDKENIFDVPESLVTTEKEQLWNAQLRELQQRNLPISALGQTEDEVKAEFAKIANRRIRLGLVLAEIAKIEKIKLEEKDIEAEVEKLAAPYGEHAQHVKDFYQKPENRQNIEGQVFEKKVVDFILSKAKITEKPMDAEKLLESVNGAM